jgi:hypothetical protein
MIPDEVLTMVPDRPFSCKHSGVFALHQCEELRFPGGFAKMALFHVSSAKMPGMVHLVVDTLMIVIAFTF